MILLDRGKVGRQSWSSRLRHKDRPLRLRPLPINSQSPVNSSTKWTERIEALLTKVQLFPVTKTLVILRCAAFLRIPLRAKWELLLFFVSMTCPQGCLKSGESQMMYLVGRYMTGVIFLG